MNSKWLCNTVICVDDEESVLDSYRRVLEGEPGKSELSEIMALIRQRSGEQEEVAGDEIRTKEIFKVLLASSGEIAVDLVRQESARGARVAAGFFDMRMPGGIDGYETIKRIREIDENIICAVVTAYTDRSVTQIRNLFTRDHQDELLYFKKPFSPEELEQSAINMVSSWNQKRRIEEQVRALEKHKQGLGQILHAVATLTHVPPHSLSHLIPGLLFHLLAMVEGEHGYAVFSGRRQEDKLQYGVGKYDDRDNLRSVMEGDENCRKSFEENVTFVSGNKCFMPLQMEDKALGGIYIESPLPISATFDADLLEVFRAQIVQLVFNSLYHSEIVVKEREVVTDPLTGLYNRRFIQKRLKEELVRAVRYQLDLAVVMLDLDDFKKVNDTYGHDAGDYVLRKVGKILRLAVREYDIVGRTVRDIGMVSQYAVRFGGEEFCLILLHTDKGEAAAIAERARHTIASTPFVYQGKNIRVTSSCGVYTGAVSGERLESEDLLKDFNIKADLALYKAKEAGKNRVVVFSE